MNFSAAQWIAWFGATLLACITLMGGAYATFETANHAQESKNEIHQRLDRIESKIDTLIERSSR